MKSNKTKLLLSIAIVGGLSGCSTIDIMQEKAVRINGDAYYYNEDGEIELTQEQLETFESDGHIVRIKHVAPSGALILDPEEMTVLMQDREIFFSKLDGVKTDGEISVLVKKGSLRENIERIIKDEGWANLNWQSYNYHIDKPFAISGPDVPSILVELIEGFPVYASFDIDTKEVSIVDKGR